MSKMVQIRHVPDALHRRLKARAAGAGMTLSDYLRRELEHVAGVLSYDEMRSRLAALPRMVLRESPADVIRAERDSQ